MWVLPAIEALHANFPNATISLLASPGAQGVLLLFPLKDILAEIIDYDPKGKHKSFFKKLSLIFSLRRKQYDLIYSPDRGEGMREEVLMSFLIGAPHRLGFRKGRVGFLHTITVELKDDISLLRQNLDILKAAHLEVRKEEIDLYVPEEDMLAAKDLLEKSGLNKVYPLVIIHPGASWNAEYKCWPLDKYISLMRILLEKLEAKVIIVGSPKENEIGTKILEEIQHPGLVNMIGKTTIPQMAALLQLSHLFIGNDSGPLHIALTLKIPSVAIFGFTSPEQILSTGERCIVIKKNLSSSTSYYLHQYDFAFDSAHMNYVNLITVDEVMAGVRKMLVEHSRIPRATN